MLMIIKSNFKPAWWLKNSHLQTLWASKVRRNKPYPYQSETLELPDGDFVELAWNQADSKKLVCLFHGLEGSLKSQYAIGLFNALTDAGYRVVLMHFRSCGKQNNRLLRSYHSGETGDIAFLFDTVQKREFDLYAAIGVSLGGNALLKYLGTNPAIAPAKAVSISAPIMLNLCSDRLDKGFSRIYLGYLLKTLKQKTREKQGLFEQHNIPFPELKKIRSFWTFDDQVTAPVHGFANAVEYYNKNSAHQFLKNIKTPTLMIHAKDDPFMTTEVIPEASELSDQVRLELSSHGGHVGFVSGINPLKPQYWINKRVVEYLESRTP